MLPTRRKRLLRSSVLTAALLLLTALLPLLVMRSEAFALGVYLPFSRAVPGLAGRVFSFAPYAVAEDLLVLGAALAVFCAIRAVVRGLRERAAWTLLLWLSNGVMYAACAVFLFVLLWGGTYFVPKPEERLGLHVAPVDEGLLYLTAEHHLDDVVRYASEVPRDTNGTAATDGFDALAAESVHAMRAFAAYYKELSGRAHLSPPKQARSAPLLGRLGIAGIYVPFTGEALVNPISTAPFLPAVMTHELAHRLGFAPEDDANFAAYLACMASGSPLFRYSGSMLAFTYCYNALTDPGYRRTLWARLSEEAEPALLDYARNRAVWDSYDGYLRERAESVNNAYLQAMGQTEGVRSYGRVADLLIALYIEENK